jgi:phosphoribosylanthranilate isomerase
MPIRVHISGLTRPEDAGAAAAAGADAFGLVFWRQSSSSVSVEQAREIVAALPKGAMVIGSFVDAVPRTVERTLEQAGLTLALFAGDEDPDYCKPFAGRYVKVIRVRNMASLEAIEGYECPFFVLDGDPAVHAGVREVPFDVLLSRRAKRQGKVVISGGLTHDTVTDAIRSCRPWGVEVSACVEAAQGIKDAAKLARFVALCRSA